MKMLMAMMLVLALPLVLVAEDGWRTWDSPAPTKKSAPVTEWLPDVPAVPAVISNHPMASALNEEGFPPRSAALAVKEKETIKKEMPAAPVVVKEVPAAPVSAPVSAPVASGDGTCSSSGSCGTVTSSGGYYTSGSSAGSCSSGSCGQSSGRRSLFGRR